MPKLTVSRDGISFVHAYESPALLSDLLSSCGYLLPHPCGGQGTCGKCTVILDGKSVLACRTTIEADAQVILPQAETLVCITGAQETGRLTERLCLCLDIGTTTLALALVSIDEARIVRSVSAPNPQRAFGADVISRIGYCMKHGPREIQRVLLERVREMITSLLSAFSLSGVDTLYVAGNTTMLHLFFGVDCSSMGVSPYTPVFLDSRTQSGVLLGMPGVKTVRSLPGISAFVGADITAGMEYIGLPPEGKYNILLDLGTNAEIALIGGESILCTAAAAGPCFEGANISCGMSASLGAVCACGEDGRCSIIGGGEAKGLCATGLIDAIALGVKRELIDETGYLEDDPMPVCEGVALTGRDIREFQLAKSAIRAAMECLIRRAGITFADVAHLYVAGGFSAGLDIENAAYVGLIPDEFKAVFSGVNNACLLGAVQQACSEKESMLPLDRAQYVDLSADPLFSQLFMEYMMF